jgi:hypothetical protein
MHSTALLEVETHKLRAAHEKQKQKRQRSTRQIPNEGGMTVQEGQEAIQQATQVIEPPVAPPAAQQPAPILPPPPVRRRQARCSGCQGVGHSITWCPNR